MSERSLPPLVTKIFYTYPYEKSYKDAHHNHMIVIMKADTFSTFVRSFTIIDSNTKKEEIIHQKIYQDNPQLACGGGIFYGKN